MTVNKIDLKGFFLFIYFQLFTEFNILQKIVDVWEENEQQQ
jgi:hypothetical protein